MKIMNLPVCLRSFAGIALWLTLLCSVSEAAKGIQKNPLPVGQQAMIGVVQQIQPNQDGYGMFRLKTAKPPKNVGANGPVPQPANAKTNLLIQELNVTANTRFEQRIGKVVNVVSPIALKPGARVRVVVAGANETKSIQILTRNPVRNQIVRYRTANYRVPRYHGQRSGTYQHSIPQQNLHYQNFPHQHFHQQAIHHHASTAPVHHPRHR